MLIYHHRMLKDVSTVIFVEVMERFRGVGG